MREVMQKIIATEAKAKQMVQAAQAEADRLLLDARKEAQELMEFARREMRIETQKNLAEAEERANLEKVERLANIATEINREVRLDDATARQAVDAAVRCVRGCAGGKGQSNDFRIFK